MKLYNSNIRLGFLMRTICLTVCLGTIAQLSSQYRVTRCSELGLRPVDETGEEPIDLLGIYLDGDEETGIGGLDCWVFNHNNNRDYVIVPRSWHPDTSGPRMALINNAMEAITDARKLYLEYGTLDRSLYYILNDQSYGRSAGETYWIYEDDQCWMRSGVPNLSEESSESTKFVFAHEIGHCFMEENVPKIAYADHSWDVWFDESVSEYLASEVYKTNNREFVYSRRYNFDAPFMQPYNAYVLWYYYVMNEGKTEMAPLLRALSELDSQEARFDHLRSEGFDQLFHNFLYDFTYDKFEDSGGGRIPNREETMDEVYTLDPDERTIILPDKIKNGQREYFMLVMPQGYDIRIQPAEGSELRFFQSLMVDGKKDLRNWSSEQFIEGNCDRGEAIMVMISHLNTEAELGLRIDYELIEREGCCAPDITTTANPDENNLNGQFYFDYYIESEVRTQTESGVDVVPMKYYVNSVDGSILLQDWFFMDNFGTVENDSIEAQAVIWLANGQLAAYVLDKGFSQRRVITMDMNQTREDVMGPRAINPAEIFREGRGGTTPEALPAGSTWHGNSTAYAYMREERFNPGVRNKYTGYISNELANISSSMSSFGFMVGYIKDQTGQGKKLVYSHYSTPDGEWIDAHLLSLEKMCASFDGAGYKKMTLMGSTGAVGRMSQSEREDYVDSGRDYQQKLGELLTELGKCGDDEFCQRDIKQAILDLQKEQENRAYNLNPNTAFSGTAGSDFQEEEQRIRDRMYSKQEEIIQEERRCATLDGQNVQCGGCMDYVVERCNTQLESLNEELDQMECELARLHGAADMLDCE